MERKPLKKNEITVVIKKPSLEKWADLLTYLSRVIDPLEIPNYTTLIGLASYSRSNGGLTVKQEKIAQDLVEYARGRGLL